MVKNLIVILIFILMSEVLNAQQYKITYEETVNNSEQLAQIADPILREQIAKKIQTSKLYTLYYKNGRSNYKAEEVITQNSDKINVEAEVPQSNVKIINMGKGAGVLYKDIDKQNFSQEGDILGKEFLINDTLPNYNWEITSETKIIGDFVCTKAKGTYDGQVVVAWYTASIPMKDGPSLYWGLPGLIVELSSGKKQYKALSVNEVSNVELIIPIAGKKIDKVTFDKQKEERIKALKQSFGQQ